MYRVGAFLSHTSFTFHTSSCPSELSETETLTLPLGSLVKTSATNMALLLSSVSAGHAWQAATKKAPASGACLTGERRGGYPLVHFCYFFILSVITILTGIAKSIPVLTEKTGHTTACGFRQKSGSLPSGDSKRRSKCGIL